MISSSEDSTLSKSTDHYAWHRMHFPFIFLNYAFIGCTGSSVAVHKGFLQLLWVQWGLLWLRSTGSRHEGSAVAQGLSCSMANRIFLDQLSNPWTARQIPNRWTIREAALFLNSIRKVIISLRTFSDVWVTIPSILPLDTGLYFTFLHSFIS